MGQTEDVLLDLNSRMTKAMGSLSDCADSGGWEQKECDLMGAKASGIAMAITFVTDELKEKKPRRVY